MDLRPEHVETMFQAIGTAGEGAAIGPATVRRVYATLMSALNTAVRRGLIPSNPARFVELPPAPRPATTTWSGAQLAHFLLVSERDRLHLAYLLMGLRGLRRGEVVGLRWSDVDLESGVLHVHQQVVLVGGAVVTGEPKSAAGHRAVAIDEVTTRLLHWHACRQRVEQYVAGERWEGTGLVFTTTSGTMLSPAYVSRHFQALIASSGLPRIRLHDLRHTSASLGLASGESLLEVSRRLGHSSITVTGDIYTHVSPQLARQSADRLAAEVFRAQT